MIKSGDLFAEVTAGTGDKRNCGHHQNGGRKNRYKAPTPFCILKSRYASMRKGYHNWLIYDKISTAIGSAKTRQLREKA